MNQDKVNLQINRAGDAYVIGASLYGSAGKPRRKTLWNPDELNNGHLLIWGGSGSGKSVLLRDIVSYLRDRGKHIHVLDLHGDLEIDGANSMQFGTWDAQHGVNPFEFLREYNAGPEQQTHEIIQMFRKAFIPNMGPLQEAVLRRLILDTYKLKGILPRDMDTWGEDNRGLPVMEDMQGLILNILAQEKRVSAEELVGRQVREMGQKIGKLSQKYRTLRTEQAELIERGAEQHTLADKSEKIEKAERAIEKAKVELQDYISRYIEEEFVHERPPIRRLDTFTIDYEFYLERRAKTVVEHLRTYVDGLVQQGVFSAMPPPVKPGLNRYDLSNMNEKAQIFFVDVLIGKVFRALRMRGEYMKLEKRPRGDRLDTYIVIDEAQKVMPDKASDRDKPNLMLNRIIAEARKYGLGLIVVTQSPSNFSSIMLANAAQKMGFNTNANDIPAAKRLLGITQDHLFTQARQKKGVAIVSDRHGYMTVMTRVPLLIGETPENESEAPRIGNSSAEGQQLEHHPIGSEDDFDGRPSLRVVEGNARNGQQNEVPQPAVVPRF